MICPQCGAAMKPTAIFCHRCGRRLIADALPEDTSRQAHEPSVDMLATQEAPATPPDDHLAHVVAAETREWLLGGLPNSGASLAPGAMIGTQYQVTRVFPAGADGPVYEVVDQLARVQCWSCEAPWQDQADDQFCERCGAERRGEALFLRELQFEPEALTEARTMAPNALISGDRLFAIIDFDPPANAVEFPPDPRAPSAQDPAATVPTQDASADLAAALAVRQQNDAPTIEAPLFEAPQAAGRHDPLGLRVGVASDVGRARRGKPNEDTALVMQLAHAGDSAPDPLTLCVVADGLGGHEDGQRASRLAARIIAGYVTSRHWLPALAGEDAISEDPAGLGLLLREAILAANAHILELNRREGGDMGCTVTAFLAQGDALCVANVGDSRTYGFDRQGLAKITTDHSLVARLVAAGMLLPEEVYTHPQRSQIYRSLGDEGELVVDIFPRRVQPGEMLVLCSDGLWEMARDPMIAAVLSDAAERDPQALAARLVDLANEHGGDDNVTVIVAQVVA